MSSGRVLVTGACGLVGSALVPWLAEKGTAVVATDLDSPANRRTVARLGSAGRVEVCWADLTVDGDVDAMVRRIAPSAIVHLAAVIPPLCYARRDVARRVNVGATTALVRAAAALPSPPRFVLASSVAVYGPRNPYRYLDALTASTPVAPFDVYGGHKVEAERAVMSSGLDWVVLRLGGVLSPELPKGAGLDMLHFEGLLPVDGHLQTVDVRDVAAAMAAATTTEATGEVFLVGGDESHRLAQGALSAAMSDAVGLSGALPPGRRGDPGSDIDWFATDFMDTGRAQEVLGFQRHSLPDLMAEMRDRAGWRRMAAKPLTPLVRAVLASRAPYRHQGGSYADVWAGIARKWGDPSADLSPNASA